MIPPLMAKMSVALAAGTHSGGAAERTANMDCRGADYAVVRLFGASANTSAATVAVTLKESDDTTASNFATWSSSYSVGRAFTTANQLVMAVDLRGRKRYLRLGLTNGTHTTNDVFTSLATVDLYRRDDIPAGTAAMVGSTNDAVIVG